MNGRRMAPRVKAEVPTDVRRAPCADCWVDTEPMTPDGKPLFKKWDSYIVRGEVWRAAGMRGWASGFLCQKCLAKRLGRKLRSADFLSRKISANAAGMSVSAHPDYLKSPEGLLYGLVKPKNRTERRILKRLQAAHANGDPLTNIAEYFTSAGSGTDE